MNSSAQRKRKSDSAQFAVSPSLPLQWASRPAAAGCVPEAALWRRLASWKGAPFRLGSYTIIDRQEREMDFL